MKIGLQLGSLRLPLKKALPIASSLGVQGIEIDARTDVKPNDLTATALRQIRKMLDDYNLRIASVRFQTRRGFGVTEDLDRRVSAFRDAMRMASDLRAQVVVNQVGHIDLESDRPQGGDSESSQSNVVRSESLQTMQSVLMDLERFGQKIGVHVGCETGTESLHALHEFLSSLGEFAPSVVLNPGNLIVNGFSMEGLTSLASRITLVHAKDGVRDLARGRGVSVELGRGTADFAEIVAVLQQHRFNGFFVIEHESMSEPVTQLSNSIAFMNEIAN